MLDRGFNILGSIVVLAMIAVVFKSEQTKGIIKEFGTFFSNAISSAEHG